MTSRLLNALDARIRKTRNPVESACLRAERAALLARQGQLDAARAQLSALRTQFDTRPHAIVSAWASLAEGLVAYFENLSSSARDKFMRALALSEAVRAPSIQSVSAAWLAQMEFSCFDFEPMVRHLTEALEAAPKTQHSARSRASLVIAEAYHWCERLDLALPWYSLARQHATAEGDEATLSALMHNMAWLRTAEARRRSVFGAADADQARHARLGAESVGSFDHLVGTNSLNALVPLLRSQALMLTEEFEPALELLVAHTEKGRNEGLDRMACVLLADTAWCRLRTGDVLGARVDASLALGSVTRETHVDDLAMTHSRLSQIHGSLGEVDLAGHHDSLAKAAWQLHMDRQVQLTDLLARNVGATGWLAYDRTQGSNP